MKRYRIFSFDFDSRAHGLDSAPDEWDDKAKEMHEENRKRAFEGLKYEFGELSLDEKIKNFVELKFKPFSVLSFHNKFLEQVRNAFVIGSYYPALTGACALGERILNHLMLTFREYHKASPEYKKVYRKDSFDSWTLTIDTLLSWEILLPEPGDKFRALSEKRNSSIHFNPETDHNDRELALEAIHLLQEIVAGQFAAFGNLPWLFIVPGECYIKKEWETTPFVQHIYLPNCALVGPKHEIQTMIPKTVVNDQFEYEDRDVTDEEYAELRRSRRQR